MSVTLQAPDLWQCQCLVPNGHTFMTLGGKPGRSRCTNAARVIVRETTPSPEDGLCGSMSLCKSCLEVFYQQFPDRPIRVEVIEDDVHHTKRDSR